MLPRRHFLKSLATATAATAFPHIARGAATRPTLHLGLVADPQYADVPPIGTRFYRESIGKLTAAIEHFNPLDLDFCVNAGDSIDRDWASYDAILKVFAKSKHKFHQVLGNHDFELPDDFKARVPERLGMARRYYSVSKNGFCLAMLDTNDLSLYAYPKDAPETTASIQEFNRHLPTGAINIQPWNGSVGPAQLKWLEEICRAAAAANEKVIIFAHHPILPAGINHNEWNSSALVGLVTGNKNVVAWINGHNHAGAYALHEGVPYITLRGMVETKNTNAFATAQFFPDRLILQGQGREPFREIPFRTV
jgi:manganese-dependent ADP-ribose/CDP-alcohol diphosphatase